MFALTYEQQDYDGGTFQLIAVSEDKSKLEARRDEMKRVSAIEAEKSLEFQKACTSDREANEKVIEEYFQRNQECLREQVVNNICYDSSAMNISYLGKVSKLKKEWHDVDGNPYPAHVFQKIKEAIIYHGKRHYFYFVERDGEDERQKKHRMEMLNSYFHADQLKEPLPQLKQKTHEPAQYHLIYGADRFFISEVEVL